MIQSDIRTRALKIFGDEAQVQVTNEDITLWINDAQRYIAAKDAKLIRNITTTSNLVVSTATYSLPATIYMLQEVSIKRQTTDNSYYALDYLTDQDWSKYVPAGWDGTDLPTGTPVAYSKVDSSTLRLYPIPDTSITNGLKLKYTRYPTDVSTDGAATLDIPAYYHEAVLLFVLWRMYIMDEDAAGSQLMQSQLDMELRKHLDRNQAQTVEYYPTITVREDDL